ncbi:MAG: HD-GYP domain-containing protein [Defluviitaleaceae bacterium]|nr:HD-GYP domain-containing protein [Defluviitaleaceae bacterium]
MYAKTIKISEAEPGMALAESVYVITSAGGRMLAARKGATLDASTIRLLTTRDVSSIEIYTKTAPETGPQIILPKDTPKPEVHTPVATVMNEKLKEEAVDSVKQLFSILSSEDGNINKTTAYQCVNNVESVVDDLLNVITDDSTGLIHINDLKQYDEYTYHHSLSVSVLSIATGKELGMDADMLFRLGRCAMLHDIGKQLIPITIINKKGKLTDSEFLTVKNHPVLGAESLAKNEIGDEELWNGIKFHHEKVNGTGYPNKLNGKEIPLFSRIIAVGDVYDAVTSYRSYRSPMLPSEAFDVIFKDVGVAFDYDVVKAFLAKLELFPKNTIVSLSNGKVGTIVHAEGASKLRPAVRLWGTNDIIVLALEKYIDINITKILNPEDLPNEYFVS